MQRVIVGVFGIVLCCAVAYTLLCAILYLGQDRALFYPRPDSPQLWRWQQPNRVEIASAGETLEGWWFENHQATSPAVILYFGGNGEQVLQTLTTADRLDASKVLFVNYRGYGQSTGKPGQDALYEDALAIYDYAIARGVQP
jgi:uncharacterized protein